MHPSILFYKYHLITLYWWCLQTTSNLRFGSFCGHLAIGLYCDHIKVFLLQTYKKIWAWFHFQSIFLFIIFMSPLIYHSTLNNPMFELIRNCFVSCAPLNFRNFVWPHVQLRISYDFLAATRNKITFISCFDWTKLYIF